MVNEQKTPPIDHRKVLQQQTRVAQRRTTQDIYLKQLMVDK